MFQEKVFAEERKCLINIVTKKKDKREASIKLKEVIHLRQEKGREDYGVC